MKIKCNDGTEVIFEVPENKHIGVMLSGGMDSALVLYLVLRELKPSNKLTVFNVPNHQCNSTAYSQNIVKHLEQLFNTSINLKSFGLGQLPHDKIVNLPAQLIIQKKLVDVLFSGANQNPPIPLPENVKAPWRADPTGVIPEYLSLPFIHLYKKHILEIYQKFDMLQLAYITHSCTEASEHRCNKCFQCFERQWAFDELGLVNYDTRPSIIK